MGLDCYFVIDGLSEGERIPVPDENLNLVGGALSGHGDGSFRGHVYDEFVSEKTGYSLYEDLDAWAVAIVADRLEDIAWNESISEDYPRPDSESEFEDLCTMFRFYADRGARMIAWF